MTRIKDGTISGKIAKQVFESMWESGKDPDTIIAEQGLRQVTDDSVMGFSGSGAVTITPEPTTALLIGLGLVGLGVAGRRAR